MAISIVDARVTTVQSPFLDQLARDSRARVQTFPCEVVGPAGVRVLPLRASRNAAWRLVRMVQREDETYRMLWALNGPLPRDHLVLAGEGFEFTAERVGDAWSLGLSHTAPADVVALLN